mgnify:CR=1 FL=1
MKKVSIIIACLFAFLMLTACGTVAQSETALPATDAEFDALFEDLAMEKSGAEEILTRLKAEQNKQLLSYLMTGFLDDASKTPWGEYKKGFLDLCVAAMVALTFLKYNSNVSS